MIFLFLLLLFGVGEVWGIDYALSIADGLDPAGNTENGQLVYETPIFDNPMGIDQISYTYNVYYGAGSEWMIVEYSLDGINYEEWNTKPYANNGSVVDEIPANHPARSAVRFRFRAGGANCWRTLWSLNIRRVSYLSTIIEGGTNNWSGIDDDNDIVTWPGTHVTFKLTGSGSNGLESWDNHALLQKSQYHYVSWRVEDGYTINVTKVSVGVRATYTITGKTYTTVGTTKVEVNKSNVNNAENYTTVESQILSLGNSGNVSIYPESTNSTSIFHIRFITVNYTIANNYKVHFDANGGLGSMSDQNFVYGTAQNLTSNSFTKSCTVTFDANEGSCGTASSTTDYDFEGWATSSSGAKVYNDGQNVNNLTTTANGVVNLFAKWSSSPSSIELPTPTRSGYTFAGWFNSEEEFVGAAGDSYTPSEDETLKAHWKPGVSMTISNLSGGDLVVTTEHVRFTLHSDGYNITDYKDGYGFYVWKPLPKNTTKDVTLSWEKTIENGSYSINVTNISFKAKAYNSNAFVADKGKISFNGGDAFSIGTAATTTDGGWSSTIGGEGDYESGVVIQLINTSGVVWETFDYHFKDFQIEYTITPNAPTASETDLAATLDLEDKQTVALNTLFSMTDPAADFVYAYRLKEDYANAHIEDGYFWATEGGDYEVQACVASGEDHEASAWSTATIHVTKTCIFNGTSSTDWQTTGNWEHSATPTASDAVRVLGNVTVDEEIEMLSLSIEGEAIVEVAPNGGLKVGRGGITGATASNLILKAGVADDVKGKTGYLRISPACEAAMPNATVEIFTKSFNGVVRAGEKSYTEWQYVGSPLVGGEKAKPIFNCSYIYNWNESEGQWENNRKTLELQPFTGYATTQYQNVAGMTITYEGELCPNTTRVIPLSYTAESAYPGCNMLANSYVAPIDITKMIDADFSDGVEATIYLFNTGSTDHVDGDAGQYVSIPINNAGKGGLPSVIPALQGFLVKTTQAGSSLTLNYERVVWSSTLAIQPLRVQAKKDNESTDRSLNVTISTDNGSDKLYLFESENYSQEFENGYDAHKMMGGACNIFTLEGDEQLSVDATNSIIGTRIGVRTGDETAYTLGFSHLETEDDLALWDNETAQAIDIIEGATYTFFAEPNATINDRFVIIERQAPTITTGVDNTDNNAKVQKFIKDNQMYILKNGRLYNAMGTVVR